jgi:hypothetical protein
LSKLGTRGDVFWTLWSALKNPWIVGMLTLKFDSVAVARIKLKDGLLPIQTSSKELRELYYLCRLRKLIRKHNNFITISSQGGDVTFSISQVLRPRLMEMIVYANIYGPMGLRLHEVDDLHYLVEITRQDRLVKLKVEKDRGVGVLGEVFCDEVYGKLAGNIQGKSVIDVGAFVGDSAIYFASKGAKEIYAFEPDKTFFDLAFENVSQK